MGCAQIIYKSGIIGQIIIHGAPQSLHFSADQIIKSVPKTILFRKYCTCYSDYFDYQYDYSCTVDAYQNLISGDNIPLNDLRTFHIFCGYKINFFLFACAYSNVFAAPPQPWVTYAITTSACVIIHSFRFEIAYRGGTDSKGGNSV